MNYEIIKFDTVSGQQDHIVLLREDGSFESFPVDENNPRYQQFLKDLEGL